MVNMEGPKGKYTTLPVEDLSLSEGLKVGEIGVITYAAAVAVSIQKIEWLKEIRILDKKGHWTMLLNAE